MMKYDFSLEGKTAGTLRELPVSDQLNIPVKGMLLKTKRGAKLEAGTLLAQGPETGSGDVHSPVAGKVATVSYAYLSIKPSGEEDAVEAVDITAVEDEKEQLRQLRALGIDTRRFESADLLVVNAMNPEPQVTAFSAILRNEAVTLQKGIDFARKLTRAKRCVVARPETVSAPFTGCEEKGIAPVYPKNLNPLVVKAVTGKENPAGVVVLDVLLLWQLGRVIETGLPVSETILTFAGENWRAKIGTPVGAVLEAGGVSAADGDVISLGGPLRGRSAYSLDQGIAKDCYAVSVMLGEELVPVQNVPCINCGECAEHCPARLQPNLITRYAEFDMFDKAAANGLGVCFECGLCAMHCTARRPLLHIIRFAKEQLRATREG